MSREIKFRAWNPATKHMWHPEYRSVGEMIDDANYKGCTLMQFTGMTDRNGEDIYQDDIIHFDPYHESGMQPLTGKVEWLASGWYIRNGEYFQALHVLAGRSKILGNIFENGDLLK